MFAMQLHTPALHPVQFTVAPPGRFTRQQLLVRFVAALALGLFGLSFATFFALAYCFLPAYAAARIGALGSNRDYLREDGDRVLTFLRGFTAVSAWFGLASERLPTRDPDETVSLTVADDAPHATAGQALLRVVTGLPSALVLMVLCWVGLLVWLWATLSILIAERMPGGAFTYLVGLQRWSVRLLAYQACLVDAYPPYSLFEPRRGGRAEVVATTMASSGPRDLVLGARRDP